LQRKVQRYRKCSRPIKKSGRKTVMLHREQHRPGLRVRSGQQVAGSRDKTEMRRSFEGVRGFKPRYPIRKYSRNARPKLPVRIQLASKKWGIGLEFV